MEEQIIDYITEAFSMQPETLKVWTEKMVWAKEDKNSIEQIKYEINQMSQCGFYVGYNFKGKKLFQYLANSVNVHYKV